MIGNSSDDNFNRYKDAFEVMFKNIEPLLCQMFSTF